LLVFRLLREFEKSSKFNGSYLSYFTTNSADTLGGVSWRGCQKLAGIWLPYVQYIQMHAWVFWFFFSFSVKRSDTRLRNFFMKLQAVISLLSCDGYLSYSLRIELTVVSISSRRMRALRLVY
jgi:hypothetical protein